MTAIAAAGTADDIFLLRRASFIPDEVAEAPAFVALLHGTLSQVAHARQCCERNDGTAQRPPDRSPADQLRHRPERPPDGATARRQRPVLPSTTTQRSRRSTAAPATTASRSASSTASQRDSADRRHRRGRRLRHRRDDARLPEPRHLERRWSPRAAAATTGSSSTATRPSCASKATPATTSSSCAPSPSPRPTPTARSRPTR